MTDVLARIGLRRMAPRDASQPHRVATPLELLFDLVFVVAVAQASQNLHHLISEDHVGQGVPRAGRRGARGNGRRRMSRVSR